LVGVDPVSSYQLNKAGVLVVKLDALLTGSKELRINEHSDNRILGCRHRVGRVLSFYLYVFVIAGYGDPYGGYGGYGGAPGWGAGGGFGGGAGGKMRGGPARGGPGGRGRGRGRPY